jgi:phosphatidylethanolamine/phosphatidyl-N-methylethanolamine N-methyltransferase
MPWSLRQSYSLIAPFYDIVVERAFRQARIDSLEDLPEHPGSCVLLNGIGTGLDIPALPLANTYIGLDLTRAMLRRIPSAKSVCRVALVQGDSLNLPFPDKTFDHVVLHLILAVVPDSARCLHEAARVTKSGGRLLIFDKFLEKTKFAPVRRAINCLTRHIATRTDVVFEDVLAATPAVQLLSDQPALLNGWFRRIVLTKI